MKYEYNDKSLDKHSVSRSDVDELLDPRNVTKREFDLSLSKQDNLRIMFVGYNFAGRMLEVGVELKTDLQAYVFHAQTVSPQYKKLYEECIIKEQINNEQSDK